MKNKIIKYLPIVFLIGVVLVYYWKVFRGYIPLPGDLLVGAYYPWLESKWGYAVGVPVKNTLISDIFSQFFMWKAEIVKSFINLKWPLWNPYSYSGYPLIANYNSGPLNPFNLIELILGKVNGWTWLVVSQAIGSVLSMYWYLRTIKKETLPSLIGSVVYAFGGFAILWSQFVNADFAMIWIPIVLIVIEKTKSNNDRRNLLWLSPLFFLIVTAGHLQALIYAAILTVFYYVYRIGIQKKAFNIFFSLALLFSICFSAIQLLPTVELMNHSIRFDDSSIAGINYGLLPPENLITLIAPDYFGNPSTGNFWGYFNYHETVTYAGVIGIVGLIFGLIFFNKLKIGKFFLIASVVSLLFQFSTPLGEAIYKFKVPFLWTSVAGRINMIYLLGVSVVVVEMIEELSSLSWMQKVRIFIPSTLALGIGMVISFYSLRLLSQPDIVSQLYPNINNLNIGLRNLAFPLMFSGLLFGIFLLSRKIKIWKWLVMIIVLADLFRFGWKYSPIVPKLFAYPPTEITDYLKKDKSIFRIDKERAEIMPPNTWMAYELSSPSGYDPMAISKYVKAFNFDLNLEMNPGVSRYSELTNYDAEALGKYNVKYLLAIKRDEKAVVPGDNINYRINEKEWKRVFQTPAVAVLLNTKYKERARVINSDGTDAKGSTEITSYENNKVVIKFNNIDGTKLLLSDTYYPGWEATINGRQTKIGDEIVPFRTVDITGIKDGEIVFEYKPQSFRWGLAISEISLFIWLLIVVLNKKKV